MQDKSRSRWELITNTLVSLSVIIKAISALILAIYFGK
jgi:hypothetical protein